MPIIQHSKGKPLAKSNNTDENIKKYLSELNYFYFLPNKGNLGDIVISFSEFQYFDTHDYNYDVLDIDNIQSLNKEPFNLVYGGGGLWHHLYKNEYQQILSLFKNKFLQKCVILPSSFNECDDVINLLDERFIVFCREKQSYEYCRKLNNKAKFILAEDMAVNANIDYLINSRSSEDNKGKIELMYSFYKSTLDKAIENLKKYDNNYKVGYLLRIDKEGIIGDTLLKNISIDPSSFAGGYACDNALNTLLTKLFLTIIDQFEIIVTDRLHIGICAAKLGKKTILLDNSYKKISNVYNFTLEKFPNVYLSNIESLDTNIENLVNNNTDYAKNVMKLDEINFSFDEFFTSYCQINNTFGYERIFWK